MVVADLVAPTAAAATAAQMVARQAVRPEEAASAMAGQKASREAAMEALAAPVEGLRPRDTRGSRSLAVRCTWRTWRRTPGT